MINKKKVATIPLLTALIITLVFVNLNVTSTAADPGPDPGTMTFDSDIEMTFETDKWAWMSTDEWIYFSVGAFNITFYNATDYPNTNITILKNGCEYRAWIDQSIEYYAEAKIEDGDCFYILAPVELYAWSFEVVNVTDLGDGYYNFNFNETYNIGGVPGKNLTIEPPGVESGTAARIVDLEPGLKCRGIYDPNEWYYIPEEGSYYYFAWPEPAYATYGCCNLSDVGTKYSVGGAWYYNFTMNMTFDYWYQIERNFTIVPPLDWIYGERMMTEKIEGGPDCWTAYVDNVSYILPPDDSWWEMVWPAEHAGARFHITHTKYSYEEDGEYYYTVTVDKILDVDGNLVDFLTLRFPIDGIEAYQLIPTLASGDEYHISSPSCYLPEDVWFNITYPAGLNETPTQFRVAESYEEEGETYLIIDSVVGPDTPSKPADYIKAVAPSAEVTTIGSGSWFKVKEGRTPDAPSCWNITKPDELKGVTFFVDRAGDYVFRIDEVLNAAGQPQNITGLSLANVTAEEFTPAILAEYLVTNPAVPESEFYKCGWINPGENVVVSIKTDYIFHAWSYEFTLEWNPDVLSCTGVTNGDLFADATVMNGTVDNTLGELSLTGAYFDYTPPEPAPQVYGPGTLASVNFTMLSKGSPDLTFGPETRLIGVTKNGTGDTYNAIDYVTGELAMELRLWGDVTGDGKVTGGDVGKLDLIYSCAPPFRSPPYYKSDPAGYYPMWPDVNGDGKVTGGDVGKLDLIYSRVIP